MPREETVAISFRAHPEEKKRLTQHCKETGRNYTDVMREFMRSLPLKEDSDEAIDARRRQCVLDI